MDYYVARWYDPVLGHFTQADSIIPEPMKTVSYDRFNYGYGNPIKYIDPIGHDVGCPGRDASLCGKPEDIIAYYLQRYTEDTERGSINPDYVIPDFWDVKNVHVSPMFVRFMFDWEKFSARPYPDKYGVCTVGFWHSLDGPCTSEIIEKYRTSSAEELYNQFIQDIRENESYVRKSIQDLDNEYDNVYDPLNPNNIYKLGDSVPINQGQFDALVDYSFQMGGRSVYNLIMNNLVSKSNGKLFRDDDAMRKAMEVSEIDISGISIRREQEINIYSYGIYDSTH